MSLPPVGSGPRGAHDTDEFERLLMCEPLPLGPVVTVLRYWQSRWSIQQIDGCESWLIRRGYPENDYWMLSDNGGEFTVFRLNDPQLPRSEPLTYHMEALHPCTVAMRVLLAINDEPIDYRERWDDLNRSER